MRFIENGPSIPNELLNARDEGRVVFICGAGVSRAKAGLPDFFGLAEAVIRDLGAPEDGDASKVLKKAWDIGNEINVPGLISADRVFGILERDFTVEDIQSAVARSLKPNPEADLSAHKTLIRLAKTQGSTLQLITTNQDLLFNQCDSTLKFYQPPHLPYPSRHMELNGVVYLHGRVNNDYSGAEGDGFVMSSSEFGHAYLAEGWATKFIREIVRRYVVVFVGYSADDPPVGYLLEGLRKTKDTSRHIYAFQAEESSEALARWSHKGVKAIAYSHLESHSALWETLDLWAQRADDPDRWRQTALDLAMKGPEELKPHQRGQVAHIVSTCEGTQEFADRKPPAEWLCVFDPSCRYARPVRSGWPGSEDTVVDPFNLYGIDSDITPERGDPNNTYVKQDVPADAWDAFAANCLDRQDLSDENFPTVRGYYASHFPRLPRRIEWISSWIADVANQPAAVWWAAQQNSLHPGIRRSIKWKLERSHDEINSTILDAWQYLLESWERVDDESEGDWHDLKRKIARESWGDAVIRRFNAIACPYLKAGPALMSSPIPHKDLADLRVQDLIRLEIKCPVPLDDIIIPDDCVERVVQGFRKNIEFTVHLYEEVNDMSRFHICPINPDSSPDISEHQRKRGLSGYIIRFASLFEQLIELDSSKAKQEFSTWLTDDDSAFAMLRIWAGGKPELVTISEFCQILTELSDNIFWSSYAQRDLLLVLAKRWPEIPEELRTNIEDRLLKGPAKWENESDATYEEYRTLTTLNRLQWLVDNKCEFSIDVEAEIAKRLSKAPEWKPEYAKHTIDSREIRGGLIERNTEHDVLLHGPIESVVSTAHELSGRMEGNSLIEYDPFGGLCDDHSERALNALVHEAQKELYPEWAWKKFLESPSREKDEPEFSAMIVECLCNFPDEVMAKLLYPSTWWLQKISKRLSKQISESFDKVASKLVSILQSEPFKQHSFTMGSNSHRDWVTEALNSPAGHIARAILEDSRADAVDGNIELPANWLSQIERLLTLNGDPRRHVIAIISHHLGWFHNLVPEWTEQHLLSILDAADEEDKEALWAGFLWNPRITSSKLFTRLKPALLTLLKERDSSCEGHVQTLAYLAMLGWITPEENKKAEERWISSTEFRDVLLHGGDDFRSQVLWQFEHALNDKDECSSSEWPVRIQEFFSDVWPRQKIVKNSVMSVRLCELLFSGGEHFLELSEVVLPFLTKIDRGIGLRLHLLDAENDIVNKHPERFLDIMIIVLSDDVYGWPYGIGDTLEKIGKANSNLLSDPRLRELKRKWNAR